MSEVESIIKRARVAQVEYESYTQEQVDLVVSAVAWAILSQAEMLS
jgi:sulfoacetaldehyde dehydrogenase